MKSLHPFLMLALCYPALALSDAPRANVIELTDGTTLTLPPGALTRLGSPAKLPDNLMGATSYRHASLPVILAISEPKPRDQPCAIVLKQDSDNGRRAIEADRPAVDAILKVVTWKACAMQEACVEYELQQRSAAESREGEPYRRVLGYDLCVKGKRVTLAAIGEPGALLDGAIRRQIADIALSVVGPPAGRGPVRP